ncbi:MAG: NAD-dependent protein deacylase [Clostridia bacterium]|nr:NAD-dependent protein deacylase [Clostridia bacterium]
MNEDLKKIIEKSKKIVLFSGAGISCASGIPDFRSSNGLYSDKDYKGYTPEEIISHHFFIQKPELFYKFYKEKMIYKDAKPNKAHEFFAELEKQGKLIGIITQNIDGLHSVAGNKKIYELHGSIQRNYCTKCHKFFNLDYIINSKELPICDVCGGLIKPDVVLYEEPLDTDVFSGAFRCIEEADCLITVGTSLVVSPANEIFVYFKGTKVLINLQETMYDYMADLVIHEDIVKVVS